MDAVSLLEQDHRHVKQLFQQWLDMPAGQPEPRRALAERIIQELMVHERVEEEIFYPAFREAAGAMGREEVEHSKEEHELADSLIGQLEQLDLDDPEFEGAMKVLRENVEHHIEDEETKMLPAARRMMANRLDALGRDMMDYKEALTRQVAQPAAREERREQAR